MSSTRRPITSLPLPPTAPEVLGAANYTGDTLLVCENLQGIFLHADAVEELLRHDPATTLSSLCNQTQAAAFTLPAWAVQQLLRRLPLYQVCSLHAIQAPDLFGHTQIGLCLTHFKGWSAVYFPAPLNGDDEATWLESNNVHFLVTSNPAEPGADPTERWDGPAVAQLTPAIAHLLDTFPIDASYHHCAGLSVPDSLPDRHHVFPPTPPTPPYGYGLPYLTQLSPEPCISPAALRFLYHTFPGDLEQLAVPGFSAKEAINEICRLHPHGISTHLTGGPTPAALIPIFLHDRQTEARARATWGRIALARRLPLTADEVRYLPWWEIPWLTAALAARTTSGSSG